MNELLGKLSSYNIFNYLFPGVLFCFAADAFFSYSLISKDIVIGVFFYYFVGLVVSRIGSILVEPFLKWVGFISFVDHQDFIKASKNDSKLEVLSEVNNMYRTIIALFILLAIVYFYEVIKLYSAAYSLYYMYVSIFVLVCMFLYSYKKQTDYICRRVLSNNE